MIWPNSLLDYLCRPINLYTVPTQNISESFGDAERLSTAYGEGDESYAIGSVKLTSRATRLIR